MAVSLKRTKFIWSISWNKAIGILHRTELAGAARASTHIGVYDSTPV